MAGLLGRIADSPVDNSCNLNRLTISNTGVIFYVGKKQFIWSAGSGED